MISNEDKAMVSDACNGIFANMISPVIKSVYNGHPSSLTTLDELHITECHDVDGMHCALYTLHIITGHVKSGKFEGALRDNIKFPAAVELGDNTGHIQLDAMEVERKVIDIYSRSIMHSLKFRTIINLNEGINNGT